MSADRKTASAARPRPLSPHLQIYRPQITSAMSILHRATGVALSAGLIVLAWWLIAAATGEASFAVVRGFLGSWIGILMLFGWSVCLFYHLANGVRHLAWDAGYGFELKDVYASGWATLAVAGAMTAGAWIWGLAVYAGVP